MSSVLGRTAKLVSPSNIALSTPYSLKGSCKRPPESGGQPKRLMMIRSLDRLSNSVVTQLRDFCLAPWLLAILTSYMIRGSCDPT